MSKKRKKNKQKHYPIVPYTHRRNRSAFCVGVYQIAHAEYTYTATIDENIIESGFTKILTGSCPVPVRVAEAIENVDRMDSLTGLDAGLADIVIQAGLYGRVLF